MAKQMGGFFKLLIPQKEIKKSGAKLLHQSVKIFAVHALEYSMLVLIFDSTLKDFFYLQCRINPQKTHSFSLDWLTPQQTHAPTQWFFHKVQFSNNNYEF